MTQIIAFIPARKGSKSVRNKNLQKINGKSLVEHTINQAKKCKIFSRIILSSNSIKILKIGKKNKITTILRPDNLAKDHSRTETALLHMIEKLYKKNKKKLFIVILQPTSPLRKVQTIKKFISICVKNKYKNALSVSEMHNNIGVLKKDKKFIPIININKRRRQDRKRFIFENGSLYFCEKNKFLKEKKIFSNKWNFVVTEFYESIDIDETIDLKVSRLLYRKI